MVTRVSDWRVPLTYLATVFVFGAIGHAAPATRALVAPPLFQLFSGGLMLGAFFMATDPVTSPFTKEGKFAFGILCGVLTVLIRSFSGYVEGVMFSIVIMNSFTPLLDHLVLRAKYRPARLAGSGAEGRA
jgi:Na+-transporting NADH:ubiquinone oxidoreductase subunit B/electron transport complex protein RnfD